MYAYAVLIYPNITIDDEVVRDVIARATIDQKRTACCLVHDIAAAIADRAEMIILLVRRKTWSHHLHYLQVSSSSA